MQRNNLELWLAVIAVIIITAFYALVVGVTRAVPAASDLFGHSLGVLGTVLMLATETLYSLRKRSHTARWGRMSSWLKFHIFTGLVGPYLVLLHTSWKFNGLAGVLMLFTIIIVASGFIGRYIYTAVPRTIDGVEIEAGELQRQIRTTEATLNQQLLAETDAVRRLLAQMDSSSGTSGSLMGLIFGRFFSDLEYNWHAWSVRQKLPVSARAHFKQLEDLHAQRRELQREIASLAMARRLLGLWHAVHIPIGIALFTAALVHAGAAVYYVISVG